MYRIAYGSTRDLPDVTAFLAALDAAGGEASRAAGRGFFAAAGELFVARAPGRLDVMGGIADYSGALVLEMPIREAALVALQKQDDRSLKILSLAGEKGGADLAFEMPLADFGGAGRPLEYAAAREYFRRDPTQHWASYAAGVFLVLMREKGVDFRRGARLLIRSDVPPGKGVSSSAALEVAVMRAAAAAFDIALAPRETALLCQKVENAVVGAPCGVMDQMSVACGEENRLLALLCQPAEMQGALKIPEEIAFWGVDSGVRHAVVGADYGSVRVGAFMGYRVIAELAGLEIERAGEILRIEDPLWGGFLANVRPSEFERKFAARLPERVSGAEFLEKYEGTTDAATRVDPGKIYAVRVPAAHAVYENHRARVFAELLRQSSADGERRLEILGELMFQSHASYSACGLGSGGTDLLVEMVRRAGPQSGLYGAKITGGGSGGTVAVLGRRGAEAAVEGVAAGYGRETGHRPYIFRGSSPGAAAFDHLKLVSG